MYVNSQKIDTVDEFKYLGLILSNKSSRPDILLKARMLKAQQTFYAVRTNCRLLGINNVRVKLQLINALVTSVLMYGSVIYACLSNVEPALAPVNVVFAQAEVLIRSMLRWALQVPVDIRSSFLYVLSNQTTL